MYILLGIFAALFAVLGFLGLVAGPLGFILWALAGLFGIGCWMTMPKRKVQEGREPRQTIDKLT